MKDSTLRATLVALLALLGASSAWASFVGGRTDFRDESIYFVMTTRFYDGDQSNNTYCWDAGKDVANQDPNWRGDFKGLIERMDYIKALGFTAIWITPVVQNASGFDYHGYHAMDMSKVDKRLESSDVSFQTVIDEAHKRGMKIILDIVLNHTGNFGEEHLCKLFTRDYSKPQSDLSQCMIPYTIKDGGKLKDNYLNLPGNEQYADRLSKMKNTDGVNHDTHNLWHHYGNFNWDEPNRWWAQIAGDCVDLNTENPETYQYLIDCYGSFIKMGVDGFRIDTGGHISRMAFNCAFVPAFQALGEQYKSKRLNNCPFYMFAEVCARYSEVTYRGQPVLSPYFYTWQSDASLRSQWNTNANYWQTVSVYESTDPATLDNEKLCLKEIDNNGNENTQPRSNNAKLNGNTYHTPDYSKSSGLNVIDFTVHWNFQNAGRVWGVMDKDDLYNDATFNVNYVESHDYGPDSFDRFNGGTDQWAENMSLLFTMRGIPCLFQGGEIEFRKGVVMDKGTDSDLKSTGRAYYGGYLTGNVTVSDFAKVSSASGNVAATLSRPLVKHLQRLNLIRAAVPALRKGQYTKSDCSSNGGYAFKRRYTAGGIDSYALIALNAGATFSNVLNGTYTECITGATVTVNNGTLTTPSFSGKGNMRIYVLNGPGKVGEDGPYLYSNSSVNPTQLAYDGHEEDGDPNTEYITGGGGGGGTSMDDLEVYTPTVENDEVCVFYESGASRGAVTCWVWNDTQNFTGGSWPGQDAELMGKTADGTRKIFKWTYQGSMPSTMPTGLIFSNHGEGQTADLAFVNHGYYVDGVYNRTISGGGGSTTYPTLTIDKPSGNYTGTLAVTITASQSTATIVYTTDGTQPTASSTKATGSVTLNFTATTTLTAGVLADGAVRNVVTRKYTFDSTSSQGYTPTINSDELSVFYECDASRTRVTCWVWNDAQNFTGGNWPGQDAKLMGKTADGKRNIFKWTYNGTMPSTLPTGLIFSNNGEGQTADLAFVNHGYYIDGVYNRTITEEESPAPTLTIDKPSGRYDGSVKVTITASSNTATIVYTTDGTQPTASSAKATGSVTLTFTDNTVLTAGVLHEGRVRNVVSREYIFHGFMPYKATVYFKDPSWSNVYFYAWDDNGDLLGGWPGTKIADTKTVKGTKFYYRSFDITAEDYMFNIIFNIGSGDGQTIDITGINKDVYYELSSTTNKFTVRDITNEYAEVVGDVNGDGVVTSTDIACLVNVLAGLETATTYEGRADVNHDNNITAADIAAVVNILAGL